VFTPYHHHAPALSLWRLLKFRKRRENAWTPKFQFNKEDVKDDGTVNAWYVDPETGEREFADIKVKDGQSDSSRGEQAAREQPPTPKHCCLEMRT
jgi:hypothetical protein